MPKKSSTNLKPGDAVAWDSSGGQSEGEVVKKITRPVRIKTHTAAASPDQPQFIVKSRKSGKIAAHKPTSLTKR
jgi:hypothetical protein